MRRGREHGRLPRLALGSVTDVPRVAHIVLSLHPGGLEALVCGLLESGAMDGVDTWVCCLDAPGTLAPRVERAGARVVTVPRGRGFAPGTSLRLAAWLRRERIEAIHTHGLDPMFYGGIAAVLAGVPVRIHTQHNVLLRDYGPKDRLKFRLASRLFGRIVSVSEESDRLVGAYGVPREHRSVIVNGVDDKRFAIRDPAVSGGDERFVIGTIARLSREKGVDRLLEAFARARRPGWTLEIVGDGPERGSLEAAADRLGLGPAVRFLGYRADVSEILQRFDLFVLPSRTEGIPLALLEAMSRGVPVVATRVGGVPEVIRSGESGILVPPDDVGAIGRAITALAEDPSARTRLSAAGAARVREGFALSRTARAYRFLYDGAAGRSRLREVAKRRVLRRLPRRWMVWRGRPGRKAIALTFDDAPHPEFTPKLLDVLGRYGIRATFFLVGERAGRHPEIVRRLVAEGHELGNHSFTHPEFEKISWREARVEIERTQRAIRDAQGRPCRWFRPPKGKLCAASILGAWRNRTTVVLWSSDLKDYRASSADSILDAERAVPLADGDIVLYHGNSGPSLEALPALIDRACANGRRAVTLAELLG